MGSQRLVGRQTEHILYVYSKIYVWCINGIYVYVPEYGGGHGDSSGRPIFLHGSLGAVQVQLVALEEGVLGLTAAVGGWMRT